MHQRYRTKGIFLKKKNQGEADQLFTIFTEQFGKIDVLAKAVRKITSKLRSGADVFYFSEIEFIQGKRFKTLTDALMIDKFSNIRQSSRYLATAAAVAELADSFITKDEKDAKIWQLLLDAFQRVNLVQPLNYPTTQALFYYFLWNFLAILGYPPELHHCPLCEKKLLPETFFFVPQEGGVVCWRCFSSNGLKNGLWSNICVDTVKVLRVYLKDGWDLSGKLKIREDTQRNLLEISNNYCGFLRENSL